MFVSERERFSSPSGITYYSILSSILTNCQTDNSVFVPFGDHVLLNEMPDGNVYKDYESFRPLRGSRITQLSCKQKSI